MQTFELQSLEYMFSKLVTECLVDHVDHRGGLMLSRISAELFNVFLFTLKSVQFMSEIFQLYVGAFSDIMEEPELTFSLPEGNFRSCFLF